jgi:probable rRNA maturation factor
MQECNVYQTVSKPGISVPRVRRCCEHVLKELGVRGSVSVHLVGERKMRSLNKLHRRIDRPTDVLSFATHEEGVWSVGDDWGDIFLCPAYIKAQAKRFDVTFKQEMKRMIIHGMLHLLGYDHEKKDDAAVMFGLQEQLLNTARTI